MKGIEYFPYEETLKYCFKNSGLVEKNISEVYNIQGVEKVDRKISPAMKAPYECSIDEQYIENERKFFIM